MTPNLQINSLTCGRGRWKFQCLIFKLILVFGILRISNGFDRFIVRTCQWTIINNKTLYIPQNRICWISPGLFTLAQIMAWSHQATSHYLNWCWSISTTYDSTRDCWVHQITSQQNHKWPCSKQSIRLAHISWLPLIRVYFAQSSSSFNPLWLD